MHRFKYLSHVVQFLAAVATLLNCHSITKYKTFFFFFFLRKRSFSGKDLFKDFIPGNCEDTVPQRLNMPQAQTITLVIYHRKHSN